MAVNAVGIGTAVNVLWSDAIVLVFEGVFHGGRSNMGLETVNTETRPWAIVQSSSTRLNWVQLTPW